MARKDEESPVVIKKVKKNTDEAEHKGQWKVAYADFVTAMMAFFLMLWLLNATTEAQRDGIADYFSPTAVSTSTSGGGGVLSGRTLDSEGALVHRRSPIGVNIKLPPTQETGAAKDQDEDGGETEEELRERLREREREEFEQVAEQLNQAVQAPGLEGLRNNLRIEQTEEGLKIQILDQQNEPMFPSGGAEPLPKTRQLLAKVSQAISGLPNPVAISGHTDATPFASADGYSNWELSADRANASRRVMVANGLSEDRITEVSGRAAEELLTPREPRSPVNRRISIVLNYQQPQLAQAGVDASSPDGTITAVEREQPEQQATELPGGGPSIIDDNEEGS
jgi:chemotaxis protein MotB